MAAATSLTVEAGRHMPGISAVAARQGGAHADLALGRWGESWKMCIRNAGAEAEAERPKHPTPKNR
ncbi:hypothetical protein ACFVYE_36040 [Streptomyces sp. NPDC058239]|uniref:hypothetical protein n=1 Tax=Streptomyces sp. NPDC058239 TaxID=3346395 RepID=UPI0036EF4737